MRRAARRLAALLWLAPAAVLAQADPATIAGIRADIAALRAEIDSLRGLAQEGGTGGLALGGASGLERLAAVEAALNALTAKAEELEFRINRITTDGTNRLGDLEFRLCEIEPGCDVGALGSTPPLGGVDSAAVVPLPEPSQPPASPAGTGPDLAANEQADFERASEALAQGDFRGAADGFATFVETYPGSPLTARALVGRGEALDALGETADAARAYLDAFSAEPAGIVAPDALLGLGRNLGRLGQIADACTTLREIDLRFPASPVTLEAQAERRALNCP
ncbi:tol-pal system protein YbgF [Rubellimicrobium thermophilum DSM 16684]|uniref:Cell division coordinator CpoB n=1 Tax=Rubellimicrobium thermophilum DSM 16684 TaxID=1123069 RepID=S9R1S7_9RHOB|nr:tol-pal system protein YbgF [Rubellimicrobium thermophilum]EPX85852.1 tol-pal system protein YbgF [Rubellimicrobium thermophilum DSM 16684]